MKRIFAAILVLTAVVVALQAQTVEQFNKTAKDAFDKQDYSAARVALDAVLKRQPANEAALTLKARAFIREAKFAEALQVAEKILLRNPKNFEALNVRGVVKRELKKDFAGALDDFSKALEINPAYYIGTLNVGVTYTRMGRGADADTAFAKAIDLAPDAPQAYELRGRNAVAMGRYKASIPFFDKLAALDPRNAAFLAERSYSHFRVFITDDSYPASKFKADADAALAIDPNLALALALRAAGRVEAKDTAGALTDADRAIELNPKLFVAYAVRGFAKAQLKDDEGSFEEFEKAAELAPRDSWIIAKLEFAASRAKSPRAIETRTKITLAKTAEAEKNLAAAKQRVTANPWDFNAYDALNDAFSKFDPIGEKFAARDYWESLVAQNPENICAIRFLGEYKHAGYWRNMTDYLEAGLRRYDGRNGAECAAQIAFRIGREFNDRRLFSDAETYFAKAKALKPDLKYLDGNIAANTAEKSEAEKPLPVVTTPSNVATSKAKAPLSPIERRRVEAAIADYDRVHNQLERDLRELVEATNKYAKAGGYRSMYRGTYQRIGQIQGRMLKAIGDLLKRQKDFLPQPLLDHLDEDRAKIAGFDPPSPYQ